MRRYERHLSAFAAMSALAALSALATFAPGAFAAGTATGSLTVNATVVSSCTVSGATLNFGNSIDPLATGVPLDATSSLNVVCTNTTPYTVSMNAGANAGGPSIFSARAMKNGAYSLGYQLYLDSSRATVWGDGTASSTAKTGTGSGSTQSLTIYGRIPALTGTVPGSYSDTVTVTISY